MGSLLYSKPKIFIGSSTNASPLVKWTAEQIRNQDIATPIEWNAGGFAPSKSTLQNLVEQCKVCDFALIFFTRDDDKSLHDDNDSDTQFSFKGPRDNTIFEAGLFLGGLGLQPERCILVSSVEESKLPSDLRGITYVEINEPPPLEPPFYRISDEWCFENLQKVIASVINSVCRYGEFFNRPTLTVLTKRQLAEREQVGRGCLEKYDRVFVNSSEPEDCCDFVIAQSVAKNLRNHVYYDFHFRVDEDNYIHVASQIIDLVRILLVTYFTAIDERYSEGDLKKDIDLIEFLKNKAKDPKFDDAIREIRRQLKIFIHKEKHLIPYRISIHNVSSLEKAKCYLRFGDYYVEWLFKAEAQNAIDILKKDQENNRVDDVENPRIFHSTVTFDLYRNEMQKKPEYWDLKHGVEFIQAILDNNKDAYKLSDENDRNKIFNLINRKLLSLNTDIATDIEDKVKDVLLDKIIELFPVNCRGRIEQMCFGDDAVMQSKWQEKTSNTDDHTDDKEEIALFEMKRDVIQEDDTLDEVYRKIKDITSDEKKDKIPVFYEKKNFSKIVSIKRLKELIDSQQTTNISQQESNNKKRETQTLRSFLKLYESDKNLFYPDSKKCYIPSKANKEFLEKIKSSISGEYIIIATKNGSGREPVQGYNMFENKDEHVNIGNMKEIVIS